MNWDAIAAVAELLAAIAVILSVLYLAFQVKQSAIGARAATASNLMASAQSFASNMYMDPTAGKVFVTGMFNPDELDESDWLRFTFILLQLLRGQEAMYLQHKDGVVTDEYWATAKANLARFCNAPGFNRIWDEQASTYAKGFQKLVQQLRHEGT